MGKATTAEASACDPYEAAQAFRVKLYLEMVRAKGCDKIDIWQTWQKIPYTGPNREAILIEMKKEYLLR